MTCTHPGCPASARIRCDFVTGHARCREELCFGHVVRVGSRFMCAEHGTRVVSQARTRRRLRVVAGGVA